MNDLINKINYNLLSKIFLTWLFIFPSFVGIGTLSIYALERYFGIVTVEIDLLLQVSAFVAAIVISFFLFILFTKLAAFVISFWE